MTTILADARLGLMVADSAATDGERLWTVRKVTRVRGALVAGAGSVPEIDAFLTWYRSGMEGEPKFAFEDSAALVLDGRGLWTFDCNAPKLLRVESGREAIGSGAIAAVAAYEALGWQDPKKAVQIACRHDPMSRPPVRVYRLQPKA